MSVTEESSVRDAVAILRAELTERLTRLVEQLGLTLGEAARRVGAEEALLSDALAGRPAGIGLEQLVAWVSALGERVVLADAEDAERKRIEERALLVQKAGGVGSVDWDIVADHAVVSPRFLEIYGFPDDTPRVFESWLDRVHTDDREHMVAHIRKALEQGGQFGSEYRIVRADNGEVRWITSSGVVFHEGGRPVRLVGGHVDVTDRKRAEAELRESEWHFRTIFEQANDYVFTSDLNQIVETCNPAVAAALGHSQEELVGRSFAEFIAPEQFAQTSAMLAKKLSEGGSTRYTVRVHAPDGKGDMIWEINSRLIHDEYGRPRGLHAIGRDVTEAKRAEEHQQLLINELNHRVKNMLAIVQGLAQQSFRGGMVSAEARGVFDGRLAALAAAHSLLTRHNWTGASLLDVVEQALAPHLAGRENRFEIDGCPLPLLPKSAVSLAMAVHELATNASKYGALSNERGRVSVRWAVSDGSDSRLRLRWEESGGPTVVPPSRRGFGTRMFERSLAVELGGDIRLDFDPAGLVCEIDAPVDTPIRRP